MSHSAVNVLRMYVELANKKFLVRVNICENLTIVVLTYQYN
jgi:hypothetical protein